MVAVERAVAVCGAGRQRSGGSSSLNSSPPMVARAEDGREALGGGE